jgi:hypothetical protein
VPGSAELVGKRKEPWCLSLRMVVEQDLGHGGGVYSASGRLMAQY